MKGLSLQQFRIFNSPILIDFKPITLLTGRNNSGKSSLIKGLLLLSDYLRQFQHLSLQFDESFSPKHKLDGFENTVTWGSEKKFFSLGYQLQDGTIFQFRFEPFGKAKDALLVSLVVSRNLDEGIKIERAGQSSIFTYSINLNFFENEKHSEDDLREISITKRIEKELNSLSSVRQKQKRGSKQYVEISSEINSLKAKLTAVQNKIKGRLKNEEDSFVKGELNLEEEREELSVGLNIPRLVRIILSRYQNTLEEKEFINTKSISTDTYRYYEKLRRLLLFNLDYLGPNRTYQARIYLRDNNFTEINQVSNEYAKNTPKSGSSAKRFLQKWLKEFDVGIDVEIKDIQHSASSIFIISEDRKEPINLADKGYGAGQITTTLLKITNLVNRISNSRRTYLASSNMPPILLIEEPETNLHPEFQSKLADMFYEANSQFGLQFIIETHSEYLIRKFQVLSAKDEIDREKICVYYLDRNEESNEVEPKQLFLREDGSLTGNFGSGFFDEAAGHAMNLLKLKKMRQ